MQRQVEEKEEEEEEGTAAPRRQTSAGTRGRRTRERMARKKKRRKGGRKKGADAGIGGNGGRGIEVNAQPCQFFQSAGIARFMGGVVLLSSPPLPNANLPANPSGASSDVEFHWRRYRSRSSSTRFSLSNRGNAIAWSRWRRKRYAFYRIARNFSRCKWE